MPTFGSGIIPAAGAVAQELTNTVRRGFLESVIVQIYQADPLIAALLETAQLASGGLSPITANLQGNPMVQSQWIGPDGAFDQPAVTPGITNAEFNLKAIVTAIPFLGFEGLIQVDYSTVPLIEARVNDATNETIDSLSNALYYNISNTVQMIGLQATVDDGTFSASYGGITRATNTWWKSTYVHNNGTTTPTRNLLLQYRAQVAKKNGETPKMGICGVGTWTLLSQDFLPLERYMRSPTGVPVPDGDDGARSGFDAVMIGTTPIYCSPKCPEGIIWLLNPDYLSAYIHEKAGFQFTGFESTFAAANQFGYLGALLTLIELVSVKAQCHGKFDGLAYLNI